MAGANMQYGNTRRLRTLLQKILLNQKNGGRGHDMTIYHKEGAVVDSTAGDDANAVGDICIDTDNNDAYVCLTAGTSATHTWAQMNP